MCILSQLGGKKSNMFKGFPPGMSEQDAFQELKAGQCGRMAEAMGRRETWGQRARL